MKHEVGDFFSISCLDGPEVLQLDVFRELEGLPGVFRLRFGTWPAREAHERAPRNHVESAVVILTNCTWLLGLQTPGLVEGRRWKSRSKLDSTGDARTTPAHRFHEALARQWMRLTREFLENPQDCCPYCAETDQTEGDDFADVEARLKVDVCRVRRQELGQRVSRR